MTGVPAFCGIDVGTQGVRVALVGPEGTPLGSGARPLSRDRRDGQRHEQDADEWWDCLVGAVRDAIASVSEPVEVEALALDATSGTVLLEDRDGAPRGPALMYDDGRAAAESRRVELAGRELWDALGYRMQPTWALPKVLWLLEHGGPAPGDRAVHQADHLVRRLVGAPVATDTSHALKTGADLRSGAWPADVLADLGVPVDRLPALVGPGTVLGEVGTEAARLTGLRAGTAVRAGMTDGCASQIAAGALRPGSWSSALGTTLVVKGSTTDLVHDPHGAVYCHRHPDGGWLPGGASSTGAGTLRDALGADADLDGLTGLARSRALPTAVTYPLAGHGERFPFVSADARGWLGEGLRDDADRFAAICLGIAYVERLAYDVLGLLGADVSGPVALTGGSTRNDWWNQLRADVLGRGTHLPGSAQAATGMAILAAAEPGRLTATAERMVSTLAELVPDADRHAALTQGYVDLVGALADRGWLEPATASDVLARQAVSP